MCAINTSQLAESFVQVSIGGGGGQPIAYIALRGVGEGEYLPKYYMHTEGVSQANAYVS